MNNVDAYKFLSNYLRDKLYINEVESYIAHPSYKKRHVYT